MFERIETPLDDGRYAYLRSLSLRDDALEIWLTQDHRQLRLTFRGVVGMTYADDFFGSNGGQITRDDGTPSPATTLARADTSATLEHIRSVPKAFRDVTESLVHYRLSLREHSISLVSEREVEMDITEDGPSA